MKGSGTRRVFGRDDGMRPAQLVQIECVAIADNLLAVEHGIARREAEQSRQDEARNLEMHRVRILEHAPANAADTRNQRCNGRTGQTGPVNGGEILNGMIPADK